MIYFIQQGASGPIKIGFTSSNIASRISQIQTSCHEKLTLLCVIDGGETTERSLHAFFHAYRLNGEWFEPAPMVLNYIFSLVVHLDTTRAVELQKENSDLRARIETLENGLSVYPDIESLDSNKINLDLIIREFEIKMIKYALDKVGQNKTKAAEYLGISFRSIRHRIQKYNI